MGEMVHNSSHLSFYRAFNKEAHSVFNTDFPHGRLKNASGLPLDSVESQTLIDMKCSVHPSEPVRFFCLDCRDVPFCGCCCAENMHSGHRFMIIPEAWKYIRDVELPELSDRILDLVESSNAVQALVFQKRKELLQVPEDARGFLENILSQGVVLMQNTEKRIQKEVDSTLDFVEQKTLNHINQLNAYIQGLSQVERNFTRLKNIYDPRLLCLEYRKSIEEIDFLRASQRHLSMDYNQSFHDIAQWYKNIVDIFSSTINHSIEKVRDLTESLQKTSCLKTPELKELTEIEWSSLVPSSTGSEYKLFQSSETTLAPLLTEANAVFEQRVLSALESLYQIQLS